MADSITVEEGRPVEVAILNADPREETGISKGGDKFSYYFYETDAEDGAELKVTSYLNDLIQRSEGFGHGAVIRIERYRERGRTKYSVEVLEEGEEPESRPAPSRSRGGGSSSRGGSQGSSRNSGSRGSSRSSSRASSDRKPAPSRVFQDVVNEYYTCLVAAREVSSELPAEATNEDVRSIATALYIQANNQGISIPLEDSPFDEGDEGKE